MSDKPHRTVESDRLRALTHDCPVCGGRMAGTSLALVTRNLADVMPGDTPAYQLAMTAAVVGTTVYVLGLLLSFQLPEPQSEEALAE